MSRTPPNWPDTQSLTQDKPRKKRGCLFWGCTGCGVMLIVFIIGMIIIFNMVKGFANKYFEATPRPVKTINFSQEELNAAEQKFNNFRQTVDIEYLEKNNINPEITVSERELNILINKEEELRDSFYVDVEENSLNLEISIRIPDDTPLVGGKYFNGTSEGGISINDGIMTLDIIHAEAAGNILPESLYAKISEAIEKDTLEDPDARLWLSTINKLELRKDEMHIEFNHDFLLRQLKMEKQRNQQ